MKIFRATLVSSLLAASALVAPQTVLAKAEPKSALEQRLDRLEAEMQSLRADLQAAQSENAELRNRAAAAETRTQAVETQANDANKRLATLETKPVPEGVKAGATTVKFGGFIKMLAGTSRFSDGEVATNSLGRDFYLPQAIPVGTAPSSRVTDATAKQSRFWMNMATDVAGHVVKAMVEADFQTSQGTQGSQRTTNGYNLALRRAFLQVDKWTFGQDWSTFQYTGALPETTDFVGGAEGTVFVRQPLIRYSTPVGKGMTLHMSLENPESGTANAGSAALVENGDDSMPDFTARLAYSGKKGELSLAGLARQVRVSNAGISDSAAGYGVSFAGKYFLNDAKSADARFMVTYGHNAGRYIGLNFAPDAVYNSGTNTLSNVNEFAALGAIRVPLSPTVRTNFMGSYQKVNYANSLTLAQIGAYNKDAWSLAANIFYSPVKNVDLGIEIRHGERTLVNGADGSTDRLEVAAKYSF